MPEALTHGPEPRLRAAPPASESAGAVSPVPGGPGAAPSFLLYRRAERGAFGPPLVTAPILGPAFVDETARAGDRWCYVVRKVVSTAPLIESEASNEACLTVVDVAAPETPVGLAARDRRGRRGHVEPVLRRGSGSYRVYRGAGEGPGKRIADVPGGRDHLPRRFRPRGVLVHYTVTAVDAAGNESPRLLPGRRPPSLRPGCPGPRDAISLPRHVPRAGRRIRRGQ